MNLYDAYMTSRDRCACPPEVQEVLASPLTPAPGHGMPPPPDRRHCAEFPSLAMVYAPCQGFRMMYSPEEGLSRGTIFRELDKPLEAGGRK